MNVIRSVIGGTAVAAAALFIAPQAASAGSNLCPANRVCIYVEANFVGLLGTRTSLGGVQNVSSGANDATSSWENKTDYNARWYEDANGGGDCRTMTEGHELHYVGWSDNDELSSWATNRAC